MQRCCEAAKAALMMLQRSCSQLEELLRNNCEAIIAPTEQSSMRRSRIDDAKEALILH